MRRPYQIMTIHSAPGARLNIVIDGSLSLEDGRLLARDILMACHRADDVQKSITRRDRAPEGATVGEVDEP